jgi:hypothetical protein
MTIRNTLESISSISKSVDLRIFVSSFIIISGAILAIPLAYQHTDAAVHDAGGEFPLGVWADGNVTTSPERFEAMIVDLQSRGLNTVLFTNNWVSRHAGLLDVSDRLGFNVVFAPIGELNDQWWRDSVVADAATAQRVIEPLVDRIANHPSLKGYMIADEPSLRQRDKVRLAIEAFRARDPQRPAFPVLIGLERGDVIFQESRPDVMLIDVYPVAWPSGLCEFTLSGFGYPQLDFVGYVRTLTRDKPVDVPLWIILQTHRWGDGTRGSLREPTVEEVRLQTWLSIAEGARGIFWFTYDTQQGWRGLPDNPPVYDEVEALARRIGSLRGTLSNVQKSADQFVVTGGPRAHVGTLSSVDGSTLYAAVANRDCHRPTWLSVSAGDRAGSIRDVESGKTFRTGTPTRFAPGDGRLFEFVPDVAAS